LQVQGCVTRQPPGTLIQFRISAALFPSAESPSLDFFLSRDSLQLANFSCFLFSLLRFCFPDFRKWSRRNWASHRAHFQRGRISSLYRVRFVRVALADKWPAIIAGLSQQPCEGSGEGRSWIIARAVTNYSRMTCLGLRGGAFR